MKKTTLSLAVGLCLSVVGLAQTQRTILYEEFSGENCAPCAATNPYVVQTVHTAGNVPNKIVKVTFQVPIPSAPGANSLYGKNSVEPNQRVSFYSVPFAPYARFNGGELIYAADSSSDGHAGLITQQIINDSSINNAPFSLTINHAFNATADSITVNVTVTAAQNFTVSTPGKLKLFLALEESEIHLAAPTGTNGEKDFYDVMRKMIPDTGGTVLNDTYANAAFQNFTFKVKIPTYIYDKSEIAFVGWIQDVTPVLARQCDYGNGAQNVYYKRVHQAGYSQPSGVNIDAATSAINNAVIQCSTSIIPVAVIKNAGTTTMTSCTISYKLDAGTAQTQNWTGSLTTGQTATVTLPALTATASGSHTVTVATSLPNTLVDQNAGNDSKTSVIIVEPATAGAAPVIQGFVSSTFPPTGWALNNADHGTYSWKRSASYGGYQTTTNSAQYQSYSNASDGDIDELFVQTVDLTTTTAPQLKYDYAYNYYDDGQGGVYYDSLGIYLSTDCGVTWTTLWLEGGPGLATAGTLGGTSQFTPTATDWKSNTIDLSSYATNNNVLIKYAAINHYGNDMFVDNINISSLTGIAKNNNNISKVKIYPNPSSSQFNVNVSVAAAEKSTVSLYNVMGQLVLTKNCDFNAGENLVNIPVDQLSNGIYTVLISSAGGSYQTKVSVVK